MNKINDERTAQMETSELALPDNAKRNNCRNCGGKIHSLSKSGEPVLWLHDSRRNDMFCAAYPMRPNYVYVASSWRCPMQPAVIKMLEAARIPHYDFRNPPGGTGFSWKELDLDDPCAADQYLAALEMPRAKEGYAADMAAMERADTFILVLPAGRSAHDEIGWASGRRKRTCVLLDQDPVTPELMYKMHDYITQDAVDLLAWLGVMD